MLKENKIQGTRDAIQFRNTVFRLLSKHLKIKISVIILLAVLYGRNLSYTV
jgi:hypothetical protein